MIALRFHEACHCDMCSLVINALKFKQWLIISWISKNISQSNQAIWNHKTFYLLVDTDITHIVKSEPCQTFLSAQMMTSKEKKGKKRKEKERLESKNPFRADNFAV